MNETVYTLTIHEGGRVSMAIAEFFELVGELNNYGVNVTIQSPIKTPGEISFKLKESTDA